MSKIPSSKIIINKILELEKKNKLFDWIIDDVYFYQLIRMEVYYHIISKKKIFHQQPTLKKSKIFKVIYFVLRDLLLINKRKNLLKRKICIISHQRRIGKKDIYTGYLKQIINDFTILHQSAGLNFSMDQNSINYDLYVVKKKLLSFFKFSQNKKKIDELVKIFQKSFLLDNNFKQFLNTIINNKINSYRIGLELLRKSNFKKIILVNSYANNHLIYAAHRLKIPTIELQHGIINKNHLGYHYPRVKKNSISAFPDKLILFGEFWKDKSEYPINKNQIIPLGFPHFDENFNKYGKNKSNNNRVLVISQQTTQEYLRFFIKNILKKKKIYFTYKAHPKEDLKKAITFFKNHNISKYIRIISGDKNIFKIFKKHQIQIGVFSTALFEGYSYELKTGIIDLPGSENVNFFKNYPNVKTIKSLTDLIQLIDLKPKKFKKNIFKLNAKKNFKAFFHKELKNI